MDLEFSFSNASARYLSSIWGMDSSGVTMTCSVATMTAYWIVNAVIFGYLWKRFQPHLEKEQNPN